jgi:hypothetical protein
MSLPFFGVPALDRVDEADKRILPRGHVSHTMLDRLRRTPLRLRLVDTWTGARPGSALPSAATDHHVASYFLLQHSRDECH